MIDVAEYDLETIKRILAKYAADCEVRAFGSRVDWTAKDYSDLDLAIIAQGKIDRRTMALLREAFEESKLPFRVDVLDWHAISGEFRTLIANQYETIQSPKQKYPINWKETTFDNCADLIRNTCQPSEINLVPYIGLEHIEQGTLRLSGHGLSNDVDSQKFRFSKGDILFGKLRPYFRKIILAPFEGVCSTDIWVVQAKKGIDQRYLYYLMASNEFVDFSMQGAEGTRMPRAQWEHVGRFDISLPPEPEQKAIAHILGTLDDKMELNRRMNKTSEEMARAIFKSWFIEFNFPNNEGKPYKKSCGKMVDSEMGKVPEGWRMGTLGEEFNITMGQSPPGSTYNETGEGMPFYQGRSDFGFRFPSRRVYCTAPTRFAEAGDTLVSVRAPVGSLNMAEEKCCIGRGVAAVRHKSNSRSYTYYLMRSIAEEFERFEAEGTVFGSIGKSDFEQIECICPPEQVIKDFEVLVFPIDQRIETNERESRTLASLRDALLPKLLSGEIRVKI